MRCESFKRPLYLYLLIFFFVPTLWFQGAPAEERGVQVAITVEQAVQMALEQNPDLKIQRQDLGMARGELLKAKVFPNPKLELQTENDNRFANEGEDGYSIGLSQTFFIGPKRRYRTGIAGLNIGVANKGIENAQRLLIARAREAFYTVLLLQEKREVAHELIEINRRLVRLTEGRFRQGYAPELDVGLARIQLQQAQQSRVQIEKDLSLARANLNLLLGRPAQAPFVAQGPFRDQEIQLDPSHQLRQAAFSQRADLKAQEAVLEAAAMEIDLAKAERIPDVTFSLDYRRERSRFPFHGNASETDRFAGVGVSLPIPLFDRKRGEIAQAWARRKRASLELSLRRAVIEKEIVNAATRVEVAQRTFKRFRDRILPLAEDHFRLTQRAYAQGQAGILDVMEAQRRFSEARLGNLQALYEYNLALTEIERVVGTGLARP